MSCDVSCRAKKEGKNGVTKALKKAVLLQPEWLQSDLNEEQRKAVIQSDGPVLILAGAGSGKTRVLTYRIAYILANGLAEPREILAMTFTNKAAGEMRERVRKLAPNFVTGMWIGTFHALFARLLRREAERIGYTSSFTIYDEDDQQSLIKSILLDLNLSSQQFPPRQVGYRISMAKNSFVRPDDFLSSAENEQDQIIGNVYRAYYRRLAELNAMDFDDLLIKPIELFEQFPLVKEHYQDRFRYLLVDEYQDTNYAQYIALRMLAARHKNICVVGDDDQSIYRWRGAEIRNILDFEKDYPGCAKYRLEQNYRSVKNILSAAHSVIKNNRQRHDKKLWTERPAGELVTILKVEDDLDEARMIVHKISLELRTEKRNFADFAILYRTNAQSRVFEEALRRERIPYIIVGGLKFYERKEVKDVLGYLRLLVNPADAMSVRRVINYPQRGIGDTTVGRLEAYSMDHKIKIVDALSHADKISGIPKKTADKIQEFYQLIVKYGELQNRFSPKELAAGLVDELGILRQFKEENTYDSLNRAENVRELLNAISEFSQLSGPDAKLEHFLESVTLSADIDMWNDRANAVTLMTLHSAKGLEFEVVFIAGLEEGLFPISKSLSDQVALEEERRLFYVGATRAKEKLYLSWAKSRRRFGDRSISPASRFLKELDDTFVTIEMPYAAPLKRDFSPRTINKTDSMPDYENESQEDVELRVGLRVKHPSFGKGTVMKVEKARGTVKLMVLFDMYGEKRLVLPFAKLEIL
jgi:DNA helicase II / ATP-dependent DNA helicase PcrA